jgi:hypothetical protein
MFLTTKDKIKYITLDLMLLKSELESYLRGEWRYEYYMTVGYNKVYTGRKIYNEDTNPTTTENIQYE